jgi:hypothetical protein
MKFSLELRWQQTAPRLHTTDYVAEGVLDLSPRWQESLHSMLQ